MVDLVLLRAPVHVARRDHQDREDDEGPGDVAEQVRDEVAGGTDRAGGGQGRHPGDRHPAGDRPADLGALAADPRTQDGTGRDLGGRERHARGTRGEDDGGRRRLGGHALRRGDLDEPLAEGADDPPAAQVGADRDGRGAAEHHPEGESVADARRLEVSGGDEGHRDDTHRLLGVSGAVGQRDQRCGGDLPVAEAVLLLPVGDPAGDREDQPGSARRDQTGDDRCGQRGDEDLGGDPGPVDPADTDRGQARTDQPAEQGVGRTRGQPEQPGEEIPQDAADQAREDDEQRRRRRQAGHQLPGVGSRGLLDVQHVLGDGRRDLHGQEGADQVEHRRQPDRDLRLQGAGGDRRRHRVAGVVEAVGEVEAEGCDHQQHQDQHLAAHGDDCGTYRPHLPKHRAQFRCAGSPAGADLSNVQQTLGNRSLLWKNPSA